MMKVIRKTFCTALALLTLSALLHAGTPGFVQPANAQPPKRAEKVRPIPQKAVVEVGFVLDTTGSMGGLIAGAKEKIWSIVNEIASAKPTPSVRIGFVAYRDKGDAYVTQVHALNDDLDAAFATLQTFEAEGGGDMPEHVSKGLAEGVNALKWSRPRQGTSIYQVLFLVGDCPPHTDYNDGYDYRTAAQQGAKRGLIINTIRCGVEPATEAVWQTIAKIGGGQYFSIAQSGGVVSIATPYDAELGRLADAMEKTTVARNSQRGEMASSSGANAVLAAPSKAARAEFNAKSAQVYGGWDLTTQYEKKSVDVTKIDKDDLPANMQKMTPAQRNAYLQNKVAERKKIQTRLAAVQKQRNVYVQKKLADAKTNDKDAFDVLVSRTIRAQAARRGLKFKS